MIWLIAFSVLALTPARAGPANPPPSISRMQSDSGTPARRPLRALCGRSAVNGETRR